MSVPGSVCELIEDVKILAKPKRVGVFDIEISALDIHPHRVGGEGLELDSVTPAWIATS